MKCFSKIFLIGAIMICIMHAAQVEGQDLQRSIADKVLRFHVRANSDTEEDQALKLEVRNGIIQYLEELLAGADGLETSKELLYEHMEDVEAIASRVIYEKGYDYEVSIYFTREYFPVRKYGNVVLPPGEYEALRVDIGEAAGKNWWCILYPAMCFVESTHAVYQEEEELLEVFTEEEYEYVTEYTIRFKYLTFLNDYM